ncbi:hypothetical protein C8Q80DRAFT_1107240 [Daedaleopsis nitida]|nr:hypothetical protein C8Q80DRAFT_1107240 [Daedaleopsis nitida]
MPELPGPPSSEDEGEGDHTPLMDSRDVLQGDLTAMKTPRPPGAWLATPAPTRQLIKDPVERSSSAPPPDFNSTTSSDSGLATPPSTLSRANTLPPQTPAPPGGWVATPAPSTSAKRRGSLLKVRFDIESETASEGAFELPPPDVSLESTGSEVQPQNADSSSALQNGHASETLSSARGDSSVGMPPTPPSLRERIRKKSPGIRVLDAYGREQAEPEAVSAPVETPSKHVVSAPLDGRAAPSTSTPRQDTRPPSTTTPRSRSAVRMVDAMGREIEEESVVEEASSINLGPLSHSEAVSRIRSQVTSMRDELSDADRYGKRAHMKKCKAAELARTKITQSLQMVQGSESEFKAKSKHAQFRNKLGMTTLLPIGGADAKITWNLFSWRSITAFVLLQLLLLFVMYRYSVTQARRIFLTTYYDAFAPELYIYLFNPDTTSYPIPTCPSWSIFTAFNSLKRAGWSGVMTDALASASCAVSAYLQPSWHYSPDTVSHSWPPT